MPSLGEETLGIGAVENWALAFVLTQLVEVPILAAWLRAKPLRERLLLAFGASALTHPILWLVLRPLLLPTSMVAYVVVGEAFATLVEAWYLRRFGGLEHALLASVSSNAASWTVGRLLFAVLPALLGAGQ